MPATVQPCSIINLIWFILRSFVCQKLTVLLDRLWGTHLICGSGQTFSRLVSFDENHHLQIRVVVMLPRHLFLILVSSEASQMPTYSSCRKFVNCNTFHNFYRHNKEYNGWWNISSNIQCRRVGCRDNVIYSTVFIGNVSTSLAQFVQPSCGPSVRIDSVQTSLCRRTYTPSLLAESRSCLPLGRIK